MLFLAMGALGALGTTLALAEEADKEKKAEPKKVEKAAAEAAPQTSPYMAAAKKKPRPAGD
ncbi:MAG: hypothetical protein GWN07_18170, partial [Actinobacteria bacterium]|nr:hypothetical protein [Actinomycetota bacterium]NIS32320.1 hypothetical protein [Actinomycetota bacterium]NIU67350.1 hypothetical protein [Actinomycetota bacterium]NIW29129.1 hypothetical protein [Actinomycetota bacterium]NIX21658.1 hypothetical protein [Actinomycetota bacterium]